MVEIYTTPSCSSCRKAKKWLDEHKIAYSEKNLFNISISEKDIRKILEKTENGFDDIISTRSKIFKDLNLNIEEMKIKELVDFIMDNPSVLRRPIIIDEKRLQVGYNDEEIRCFLPREYRQQIQCDGESCNKKDCSCDYVQSLKVAFNR